MMFWLGIIICIVSFSASIILVNKKASGSYNFAFGTLFALGGIFVVLPEPKRNVPTALDVYRGKTTLQITYQDSIALDSVVVFKDEFKKEIKD